MDCDCTRKFRFVMAYYRPVMSSVSLQYCSVTIIGSDSVLPITVVDVAAEVQ